MDIALFGRNVGKESFPELGLLFQRLKSDACIRLAFYKPFYNYLIDSIKQTEAKTSGSFAILNAVEGAALFTGADDIPFGTELFLSLGGDGTFLNGVALVRDRNIPIAGINFGHLGFLTTASVADKNTETDVLLGNECAQSSMTRTLYFFAMRIISCMLQTLPPTCTGTMATTFLPLSLFKIASTLAGSML